MSDLTSVLDELRGLGKESYRKVMLRHGAGEPCYGVKIEDLKRLLKRTGKDHELALKLYDSGIYDARYLAGLMVDDARMTKADLDHWVSTACGPLAGSMVPNVAAGSPAGWVCALEWLESERPLVAVAGWMAMASLVSVIRDEALDLTKLRALLDRVEKSLHHAPNDVRYAMNQFVICVACYVLPMSGEAKGVAERIGRVSVDMGETACQVPYAPEAIRKVEQRGGGGKKRKSAKC